MTRLYAPSRGPAWWERLVDRLYGPREWSVIRDDGYVPDVYAVITSRVVRSDTHLAVGLRRREAIAYAVRHRPPPPRHFNCRCTLKDPTA